MGLPTALFGVLIISVLQGLVESQQITMDDEGVSVSYGTFLKPRREQLLQAAPNDGDEILVSGFTPLPSLGPQEYTSPAFQAERPPLQMPQQPSRLRPRPNPLTSGGPYSQFNYYAPPYQPPPRPLRPPFFNPYY